jgi:hypothetical protein
MDGFSWRLIWAISEFGGSTCDEATHEGSGEAGFVRSAGAGVVTGLLDRNKKMWYCPGILNIAQWLAPDIMKECTALICKSQNIQEEFQPFTMRPLHYLKTSGMNYPVPWHHIPSEWIPQLHYCENLQLLTRKCFYLEQKFNSEVKLFRNACKKLRTVPLVPSWHVIGWPSPFTFTFMITDL